MIFGMSLAIVVNGLITFYTWLIVAYVLMSWFNVRGGILLDVYRVLGSICEPYIGLFRRLLPQAAVGGAGLDFSPFVAILVLEIGGRFLVQLLAAL
jgi:uncharacterized protein YggT (Ycf19 family)